MRKKTSVVIELKSINDLSTAYKAALEKAKQQFNDEAEAMDSRDYTSGTFNVELTSLTYDITYKGESSYANFNVEVES